MNIPVSAVTTRSLTCVDGADNSEHLAVMNPLCLLHAVYDSGYRLTCCAVSLTNALCACMATSRTLQVAYAVAGLQLPHRVVWIEAVVVVP